MRKIAHSEEDARERENLNTWKHHGIVQYYGEFPDKSGRRHLVLEASSFSNTIKILEDFSSI